VASTTTEASINYDRKIATPSSLRALVAPLTEELPDVFYKMAYLFFYTKL
jgi:hypothetical protein